MRRASSRIQQAIASRSATLQNLSFLYGATIISYALPLITLPFLARVLGANSYGTLAFAQSFGSYVLLLVEYGFVFSATRDLARHRDSLEHRADLLAGVLGAKGLLSALAILTALAAYWWVPVFHEQPLLLFSATFWAIAMASSMLWYFQGLEQLRTIATIDMVSKTLATLLIFVFVRGEDTAWLALFLPGLGALLSTVVASTIAYRQTPFQTPSVALSVGTLRTGWTMFLYRSAVSFYTVGNAFILGMMAAPDAVAFFAGGERISKVFLGLLYPISQVLYPRMSHQFYHDRDSALASGRRLMWFMVLAGTILGVGEFIFAPLLVQIFLGPGYEPAIGVLRVMSLLAPLITINTFLGLQWMVPLGLDRPFNTIIITSGVFNIVLAVLLAPRFSYMGMAVGVVLTETLVTAAMYIYLRIKRLDPLSASRTASQQIAQQNGSQPS